jgi:hypothetical protein
MKKVRNYNCSKFADRLPSDLQSITAKDIIQAGRLGFVKRTTGKNSNPSMTAVEVEYVKGKTQNR